MLFRLIILCLIFEWLMFQVWCMVSDIDIWIFFEGTLHNSTLHPFYCQKTSFFFFFEQIVKKLCTHSLHIFQFFWRMQIFHFFSYHIPVIYNTIFLSSLSNCTPHFILSDCLLFYFNITKLFIMNMSGPIKLMALFKYKKWTSNKKNRKSHHQFKF